MDYAIGTRGGMLAVWPLQDDHAPWDELIALASENLPDLAGEQGLRIPANHTTTWRHAEPGELPGFEWCPRPLLVAVVRPVEVVTVSRLSFADRLSLWRIHAANQAGAAA